MKKLQLLMHVLRRTGVLFRWSKNWYRCFCNNFCKCTPILTIFSLLEEDIYDA